MTLSSGAGGGLAADVSGGRSADVVTGVSEHPTSTTSVTPSITMEISSCLNRNHSHSDFLSVTIQSDSRQLHANAYQPTRIATVESGANPPARSHSAAVTSRPRPACRDW